MRSSYPSLAAALAFVAAFSAIPAQAQPSTQTEPMPASPPAPNAIGQSKGEVLAARQFGWLDLNHDGFLSRDEVALFPRLRDAFDQADTDKDNRVSFEEIRALALHKREEKASAAAAPATAAKVVPSTAPVPAEPTAAVVIPADPAVAPVPAPAPVVPAPAVQPSVAAPAEEPKSWWSWRPW